MLQNLAFNPSALTVVKGDLVVFRAVDAFYAVVVNGRTSNRMQPGQSWTLNSGEFLPGTYLMTDSGHSYMRGTLTVTAP